MARSEPPDQPLHPSFGAKLAWWRRARGLSVIALARRAKLATSLIYQYERGEQNPTYGSACKLAEALEVEIAYLWDHFPPPGPANPARVSSRGSGIS